MTLVGFEMLQTARQNPLGWLCNGLVVADSPGLWEFLSRRLPFFLVFVASRLAEAHDQIVYHLFVTITIVRGNARRKKLE